MPKSRSELIDDLYQLRVAAPLWRRALPSHEEFQSKYAELTARVLAETDDEDLGWVQLQLIDLLPPKAPPISDLRPG